MTMLENMIDKVMKFSTIPKYGHGIKVSTCVRIYFQK